jgi:hypothetical protein
MLTSGAGKSTLSEMAAMSGFEVISDDLNAVEFDGRQPRIRKLPFTGTFAASTCRRESYPLGGIFRLEKAGSNSIRYPGTAESVASMMVCAPYVNVSAAILGQLQDRLMQFFDCSKPGILEFTNGGEFPEIANLLRLTDA